MLFDEVKAVLYVPDVISTSQVVGKSWGADDSLAWLTDEVTNHPVWNTANAPLILALWHNKTSPQLQKLESMGVEVRLCDSLPLMLVEGDAALLSVLNIVLKWDR